MIIIKSKEFTKEEFQKICESSESYREVAKKLGYSTNGGSSIERIKKLIVENDINIDHFKGQAHTKNKGKRIDIQEYLTNNLSITSHKLRLRLIEENIFEYKCNYCNNTTWYGNPIPLELHHIDGNKENNLLENLILLCPNCHYFTDNYKSKNRST